MEEFAAKVLLFGLWEKQRAPYSPRDNVAEAAQRSGWGAQRTMRTYTHGVIGYLCYAKRPRQEQRLAVIGGILPDVFLALGFVAHYGAIVTQCPRVEALHRLLHHSILHTVTVALHS